MKPQNITYRNKVIVVPYARLQGNNHIRILIFKDTSSGDWTFVSGGCKQKEDQYMCASRELHEESKKTLQLSNMQNMFVFTFESKHRPVEHALNDAKRNLTVITRHVVYIVKTPFTTLAELTNYQQKYKSSIISGKDFNETNDIAFITPSDLNMKKYKMWDFMQKEVVPKVLPYFLNGKLT